MIAWAPVEESRSETEPLVTVIFPCLNEEEAVGGCVDAALAALEAAELEGEVLVVDNGSTDRSAEIATERGRATRPDIKLGICGEHGGDPASIHFCEQVGLDYVSCSPFRVPIARLAAAQAYLAKKAG